MEDPSDLIAELEGIMPAALTGCVVRTLGMTAEAAGFPAPVGALVEIQRRAANPSRAKSSGSART